MKSAREVVLELVTDPQQPKQVDLVFRTLERRLGQMSREQELEFVTAFYDLFRSGVISWGRGILEPDQRFFHLTEQGRRAAADREQSPANPQGYLRFLDSLKAVNPISRSYAEEALSTFHSGCYKAAAVMIGAAVESMLMGLRDQVVAALGAAGRPIPKGMTDWKTKTVFDALSKEFEARKLALPMPARNRFDSLWRSMFGHVRAVRNDAGHPTKLEPVDSGYANTCLLLFPEMAKLCGELEDLIAQLPFEEA